jgi:hypothetical protein
MKKKINLVVLTILFIGLLIGCSKKEQNENKPNETNLKKSIYLNQTIHKVRMEIVQFPMESQRVIFASKTPTEKSEIWKDKLYNNIKNSSFTKEQLNVLLELYQVITPELFMPNSKERIAFNDFNKKWMVKARSLFPYFVIKGIVTNLNDDNIIDGPGNPNQNCNCSIESDWCSSSWKCSYPPDGCNSRALGCGTLWLYSCDGRCKYEFNQ